MEQGITWEDRVKGAYASLRPSEQKVAEFFLAHAEELEDLTIGELARGAGVSEPTVIRCVRGWATGGTGSSKGPSARRRARSGGTPWTTWGALPCGPGSGWGTSPSRRCAPTGRSWRRP